MYAPKLVYDFFAYLSELEQHTHKEKSSVLAPWKFGFSLAMAAFAPVAEGCGGSGSEEEVVEEVGAAGATGAADAVGMASAWRRLGG